MRTGYSIMCDDGVRREIDAIETGRRCWIAVINGLDTGIGRAATYAELEEYIEAAWGHGDWGLQYQDRDYHVEISE